MTNSEANGPDHGGDAWEVSSRLAVPVTSILDFSASINPLGISPLAAQAIKEGIRSLTFYPDKSCSRLRDAISAYVNDVSSDNILVGNGSTEIIHLFSQVYLERGDEAIVLQPTFSEYEYAVVRNHAKAVPTRMAPGFKLETDALLKSITPRTKAIFLCNPNNPTSTTFDKRNLEEIIEEAAKRKIMTLLDECFMEFVDEPDRLSFAQESKDHENLIVLRSLTKAFGLAGLRIGYAVGSTKTITDLKNAKVTWSVNTLAQVAGVAALQDEGHLEAARRLVTNERAYLSESLPETGIRITPPKANFVLAELQGHTTAPELRQRLLTRRILIRECSGFRGLGSRFIRLAVRKREDNSSLLRALKEELSN
jgi:threonine-phosphate decarboxylase